MYKDDKRLLSSYFKLSCLITHIFKIVIALDFKFGVIIIQAYNVVVILAYTHSFPDDGMEAFVFMLDDTNQPQGIIEHKHNIGCIYKFLYYAIDYG